MDSPEAAMEDNESNLLDGRLDTMTGASIGAASKFPADLEDAEPDDEEDPELAETDSVEASGSSGANSAVISTSGDTFVTSPDGVVKYLDCPTETMSTSHEFKFAAFLTAMETDG